MKGCIRRQGEGSWSLIVDLPKGPDGKRRQKWHTFKGTKKDAEKRLREILLTVDKGTYRPPSKQTVAELFDWWFRLFGEDRLNPHTLSDYRKLVGWYIIPKLGERRIDQLTVSEIQEHYKQLQESGGRNGRPLSGTTVRHVHKLLNVAMKQAVESEILDRNIMERVKPPQKAEKAPEILEDAAAVAQLLEVARGTWLYIPILLGVGVALRRGEVLALKWSDVDLTAQTLTVNASVMEVNGKLTDEAPKTKESAGTIDLPSFVVDALKAHKKAQAQQLLEKGKHPPIRYVVANDDGGQRTPDNLTHGFGKLAARAGCPGVTFHGLRHTSATFLLEQGVPAHVVAATLRHTDPSITLKTYAHVLRRMKQRSAVVMDGLFSDSAPMVREQQG